MDAQRIRELLEGMKSGESVNFDGAPPTLLFDLFFQVWGSAVPRLWVGSNSYGQTGGDRSRFVSDMTKIKVPVRLTLTITEPKSGYAGRFDEDVQWLFKASPKDKADDFARVQKALQAIFDLGFGHESVVHKNIALKRCAEIFKHLDETTVEGDRAGSHF